MCIMFYRFFLGGEGYRLIIRDNNRMSRLVSWPRKKLTKQ